MKAFKAKTPPSVPAWHPDFRNTTTLPDVKVVRTSFYINGISVLVLVGVALLFVFQEVDRHALRESITVFEEKIQQNTARNDEVLKMHRSFQEEEQYLSEVVAHSNGSLEVSALLVTLAESLHPGMIFTTVRLQNVSERGEVVGKQLLLNGSILATPEAAASIITDYVGAFYHDSFLAEKVKEAVPTSLVPTPEGDRMAFGIRVVLKGAEEKKESK